MMARLGDYIEQIRGVSYKPEDVCSAQDKNAVAILRANNIQDDGLNFDDLVYVKKSNQSNYQSCKTYNSRKYGNNIISIFFCFDFFS